MKAKEKKQNSTNDQLRSIREKISLDIENMDFETIKEYLNTQKSLHPKFNKPKNKR